MTLAAALPDATELASDLAAGSRSAVGLARAALERIETVDGQVRAFITVLPEQALRDAEASDARRAAGGAIGPLDGIPFAVKDNIAVAGVVTTCGTRAFSEPAAQDADVVAALRSAGAVLVGTLNMHEGALGATTDNPFWGTCQNPLAPGHTPGGSSGGSAAAIAAGIVPLTLGTDTMGSVRIPAAYCGLWGLKPSRGAILSRGLTPLSWTLDSIGPLARSPGDLALALEVLARPGPQSPATPPAARCAGMPEALRDLTLGVPEPQDLAECDPVVRDSFRSLTGALEQAGATLRRITVAGWEPGPLRRAGLLISEVEAAETFAEVLARPDGPEGLSEAFRAMIAYGQRVPAGRLARAYRLVRELEDAALGGLGAGGGLDGLLLPTAPQRAFPHGNPVPANQADFTALANVAGLPALALPIAAADGGLPCSAQIVGPQGSDRRLIAIGQLLQSLAPLSDWAQRSHP